VVSANAIEMEAALTIDVDDVSVIKTCILQEVKVKAKNKFW